MTESHPAPVAVDQDGSIRVLTLDRPQARNAMDTRLLGVLLDAIGDAVSDEGVEAIVLTGADGQFSAGADVREQLDAAGAVRRTDLFCEVFEAVGTCPKPTVAAVEGACIGGGAEVAAACDLRVGSESAAFRFPGAAMGVPLGPAKLVGLVGLGTAKDLILTARSFDVEEAERIGFLQRRTARGEALPAALAVAAAITANDRHAVAYLKRQLDRFSGLGDRIGAENDALHALAEAGGDWHALTMPKPGVGGWSGGGWRPR